MRIGVIGAGPAGLAVGWELLQRAAAGQHHLEVELYERAGRPGGNVWTDWVEGYRIEEGPEGFLDSAPRTLELAAALGLTAHLVRASAAARRRYVYAEGRLHQIPLEPLGFLGSNLLSLAGRLRVLAEPLRPRGRADDESVLAFATRRLGPEAARRLVGAMVAGVYAGDPDTLSLPAAFPRLAELERRYGSLTRGLIASRRAGRREGRPAGGPAGPAGTLASFAGGLRELIEALAGSLGPRLHLHTPAEAIRRVDRRWLVAFGSREEAFDRLVVATPPWHAAQLLEPVDAPLAAQLRAIPPAPVTAVALGFATGELDGVRLDGFGFLVPPGEGLRLLGCLWSSSFFPYRAPEGRVLLRALVGGARDPGAADLPDESLLELVLDDLRRAMGVRAVPELVRIYRHPRGIPQYTVGHLERLRLIDQRLAQLPGLLLHGNGYRGIALNDCVARAGEVAAAALGSAARPAGEPAAA